MRIPFAIFMLIALGAAALGVLPLRASSGKHDAALPSAFGQLYATLDRADLVQYRELFAPASALAAIKEGKPLPVGTVLTMVVYSAKRDHAGRPHKDAEGRFIKDELAAFFVMRKQGEDMPQSSGPAHGPWRFQLFRADKQIDRNAKLAECVACHQRRRDEDFVFSREEMTSFVSERAAP